MLGRHVLDYASGYGPIDQPDHVSGVVGARHKVFDLGVPHGEAVEHHH